LDHNKGHTGDYISKKPYKGKYSGNRSSGIPNIRKRENMDQIIIKIIITGQQSEKGL
jgi:hypothetical protein